VVCIFPFADGAPLDVLTMRPDASLVTDFVVPLEFFCDSTVWTIRPEASRTTSLQVSAEASAFEIMKMRIIFFMQDVTVMDRNSFIHF
jgi:hypothetical protein